MNELQTAAANLADSIDPIASAQVYSMKNGEFAYQATYVEGRTMRAVLTADGFIRNEYKDNGVWKLAGKPYIVKKNKTRQGERIIAQIKRFLES